jgi:hypothetical protein
MHRARLREIPALAWINAYAFTGRSTIRALVDYPTSVVCLLCLVGAGVLYTDGRSIAALSLAGGAGAGRHHLRTLAAAGLAVAIILLELAMIGGAITAASGSPAAGWAGMVVATVVLCASLVPSVVRGLRCNSRHDRAALHELIRTAPSERRVWLLCQVARGPRAAPGEGARLLEQLLREHLDITDEVVCLSAAPALVDYYGRFGFVPTGPTRALHRVARTSLARP